MGWFTTLTTILVELQAHRAEVQQLIATVLEVKALVEDLKKNALVVKNNETTNQSGPSS